MAEKTVEAEMRSKTTSADSRAQRNTSSQTVRSSRPVHYGSAQKVVGFSEAGFPIYADELIEPYMDLAKGIVDQALKDYESAYRKLLWTKREKTIRELLETKAELESFFNSGWFETLTGTQGIGQEVISRTRKQVIEGEKERMRAAKEKEDTLI